MQCLPGSQLCVGHEAMEEQDTPAARQKHGNDYQRLCVDFSCRNTLGAEGGGHPTTRRCRRVQSWQELPRESCSSTSRCHRSQRLLQLKRRGQPWGWTLRGQCSKW